MTDDQSLPRHYTVHAERDALVAGRDIHIQYVSHNGTVSDGLAQQPLADGSGGVTAPYRGLSPFREEDEALYFGREEATRQVLELLSERLDGPGLLVVSGVSGAGKSSLLRAGVLPRLRRDGLTAAPSARSWPCLVLSPSDNPLGDLADALSVIGRVPASALRKELAADPANFTAIARQVSLPDPHDGHLDASPAEEAGQRLLVIIDQCEKLFTQCTDESRHAYLSALYAACAGERASGRAPAAVVILAMRADFEARLAEYSPQEFPEIGQAVQDRFLLRAMTEQELRLAVTGPAGRAGFRVDESLVQELLAEMRASAAAGGQAIRAGSLPLLSHALDQAWRARAGHDLELADYVKIGGIQRAVALSAQEAYEQLSTAQQETARYVFTRLVATGPNGSDTAVRRPVAELSASQGAGETGDVTAVLEAFAARRLLTMAAGTVEISHESLLTAWPLLRDNWLDETRTDRVIRTRLQETAADWGRESGDSSYLYHGSLLEEAIASTNRIDADPVRNSPLSPQERDFLAASLRVTKSAARRRQAVIAGLAALTLVASVLAILANQQRISVSQQRDQANERQIIAEAGQLSATDPSLAAQLLLVAYHGDPHSRDLAVRLIGTENQPLSTSDGAVSAAQEGDEVAYSPNGKILAAGEDSGSDSSGCTIGLWNVADPADVVQLGQPLSVGYAGGSAGLAFSPDGKILATSCDFELTLWDVSSPGHPRQLAEFPEPDEGVNAVAFSPDGKTLAAAGGGGTLSLWDVSAPSKPRQIGQDLTVGNGSDIWSVAFSPDGKTLAAGDEGDTDADPNGTGTLTFLDVTSLRQPRQLGQPLAAGNGGTVATIAYSPDGNTLATDGNGTVSLWDVSSPGHPRQIGKSLPAGSGSDLVSLAFGPGGKSLATGDYDGTVSLWDVAEPADPLRLSQFHVGSSSDSAESVAFSPDGRTLAVGDDDGHNDGTVTLVGLPSLILPSSARNLSPTVSSLAFSPAGKTLAAGGGGTVTLWNPSGPDGPVQLGQPLTAGSDYVNSVAFSAHGNTMAAADYDGTVTLWDVTKPAQSRQLSKPQASWGGNAAPPVVTYSPDGKTLASTDTGAVELWNVASPARPRELGQPVLATYGPEQSAEYALAFSPAGKTLASADYEGQDVTLWNVTSPARPTQIGQALTVGDDNYGSNVYSLAFSPDGKILAAGDGNGTVTLWDVSSVNHPRQLGQPLTVGDGSNVNAVAFSPDGSTLATGDGNGTVTLWDTSNPADPVQLGQPLTVGDGSNVNAVAFSPDGSTLAAGDSSGIAQTWNLNVNSAISRICDLTSAAMTPQEWRQYVPQPRYAAPCPG